MTDKKIRVTNDMQDILKACNLTANPETERIYLEVIREISDIVICFQDQANQAKLVTDEVLDDAATDEIITNRILEMQTDEDFIFSNLKLQPNALNLRTHLTHDENQ